jgi:C1A family cysteine protease
MSTDDVNKYVNRFYIPESMRNRKRKNVKFLSENEDLGVLGGIAPIANILTRSRTKTSSDRLAPVLKEDVITNPNNFDQNGLEQLEFDQNDNFNPDYNQYPDPIDYKTPEYDESDQTVYDYATEFLEDKLQSELKYLSIHSVNDILNYVTKGFNTQVLNQGLCGSCWSFSSAAAIEAAWYFATGEIVKLSEQQLIDCNRNKDNEGCEGGNMANAFEFVQKNGGISLSSRYPYKGNDTFRCRYVSPDVNIVGYELLDPGDEDLLLEMLVERGPIAVAVDASLQTFQSYKSGVYYDERCSDNVNHAMLLVGKDCGGI